MTDNSLLHNCLEKGIISNNIEEKPTFDGQVRIRSNVCSDPNAWHLVPGDLLKASDFPKHQISDKQRDEMMYYEKCCLCQRTIYQIHEEGCDHPVCRKQGILSRTEAKRRKQISSTYSLS